MEDHFAQDSRQHFLNEGFVGVEVALDVHAAIRKQLRQEGHGVLGIVRAFISSLDYQEGVEFIQMLF